MAFWTPLTAFVILAGVFAFGDVIAYKSKGYISGVIVAALIYLVGFWTGILPSAPDAPGTLSTTGLPVVMGTFGIALIITHLGTLIDLNNLLKEWKTVLIALVGLLGIAAVCFTIGTLVFGRVYALAAAPPISGGLIASIIVSQQAAEAGMPHIGAYAMLVSSFQMFVGIPIASYMLKKVVGSFIENGDPEQASSKGVKVNLRVLKEMPPSMQSANMYLAKLGLVALIAWFVAQLTAIPGTDPQNFWLNPNVAYLLFGILFTELGFLEKNSLNRSESFGMLMMGTLSMLPGNFAAVSPAMFLEMLWPIAGLLLMSAAGIALFAAVAGKSLGYSAPLSIAIGVTALIGYPGTYLVSHEVVKSLDVDEEEKQRIIDYILPKMLVGGFVTVTVASVVFAGFIAPMIFA